MKKTDKLLPKQEVATWYLNRPEITEVLYGGAAGGGKSAFGCLWIIQNVQKYKGSRWLIGRSEMKALKETTKSTFDDLVSEFDLSDFFNWHEKGGYYSCANGSVIILKDLKYYPRDPQYSSLGSLEITGAFIDEANQISKRAKNMVKSRCRYKLDEFGVTPKVLMSCNPDIGFVYDEFYEPHKKKHLINYRAFVPALPTDNPHLPQSYLDALLQMSESDKQRLYYGNWEYNDNPDWLIESYDHVRNMENNPSVKLGGRFITCDAARFGKDNAVIMVWNGWKIIDINVMPISKTTETSKKIKELAKLHKVPISNIVVDANGVGGGVADQVKANDFINNAAPIKTKDKLTNYDTLKSQCGFTLANKINEGVVGWDSNAIPEHYQEQIKKEAFALRKQPDLEGKMKLIKKDSMKLILNGKSPDFLDNMIMRSFFELKKPRRQAPINNR